MSIREPWPTCSEHFPAAKSDQLSYLQFHDDCTRRAKLGQRQRECKECGKWRWPDEGDTWEPPIVGCISLPRQGARGAPYGARSKKATQ